MSETNETTLSPRLVAALAELREITATARAAVRPDPAAVRVQVFLDAVARPGGIAATPEGQQDTAERAEALIRDFTQPDLHDLAREPL